MHTISSIKCLLEHILQHKKHFSDPRQFPLIKEQLAKGFKELSKTMPELVQVGFDDHMSANEAEDIVNAIRRNAANRVYLPAIPLGLPLIDMVGNSRISTPAFVPWQHPSMHCPTANIVYEYNNEDDGDARKMLNAMLLNIILAFSIKRVHVTFVDLNNSRGSDFFKRNISDKIWNKANPIFNDNQFSDFLEKLNSRMNSQVRDVVSNAVNENKQPEYPFEIVVLYDFPNGIEYHSERLLPLFNHASASRAGIYFVVMHKLDNPHPGRTVELLNSLPATRIHFPLKVFPQLTDFVRFTPILGCKPLRDAIIDYINKEADKSTNVNSIEYDFVRLADAPYENVISELDVEIGIKTNTQSQKVNFWLDSNKGHFHSFILGKTGSGKSVLLHDIISNLILKYQPEDLELYLMDLKMGGPEFAKYSGDKHVAALLRNTEDEEMMMAIFTDIFGKMQKRSTTISADGYRDIRVYNQNCLPEKKLPQIVIFVDECQNLFSVKVRKIQDKINEIIEKIAREGRSQGVHFVMSTQTLSGVDIPSPILKQISDFYIMKSDTEDAEKLIPDFPGDCFSLSIGHAYYFHNKQDSFVFQSYNSSIYLDKVIQHAKQKSVDCKSNEGFEFNGKQAFVIETEDEEALSSIGGNNLRVALGKAIDVGTTPVAFTLSKEVGQNILLFGIDEDGIFQSSRVATNMLHTMILCNKLKSLNYRFVVIDGYEPESDVPDYQKVLQQISETEDCDLLQGNNCGEKLLEIINEINEDHTRPTVLMIMHPESTRSIRNNALLPNITEEVVEDTYPQDCGLQEIQFEALNEPDTPNNNDILSSLKDITDPEEKMKRLQEIDLEGPQKLFGNDIFSSPQSPSVTPIVSQSVASKVNKYYDAIQYIIEKGADKDVHIVLQLLDPTNESRFWNGNYSHKDVCNHFNYRVMLKSNENLIGRFATDNCKLDTLNANGELLRAYLYNENVDRYQLFSPYALPNII